MFVPKEALPGNQQPVLGDEEIDKLFEEVKEPKSKKFITITLCPLYHENELDDALNTKVPAGYKVLSVTAIPYRWVAICVREN